MEPEYAIKLISIIDIIITYTTHTTHFLFSPRACCCYCCYRFCCCFYHTKIISLKLYPLTDIRAEGAFLVSASKNNGTISEVKITSEQVGRAKVKNPFGGYRVSASKDAHVVSADNGFIEISFKKGGSITLEKSRL